MDVPKYRRSLYCSLFSKAPFAIKEHCFETICLCCVLEEDNKLDVGIRMVENIMQEHCKRAILEPLGKEEGIFPTRLGRVIVFLFLPMLVCL